MDQLLIKLRSHHLWPNNKVEKQIVAAVAIAVLYALNVIDDKLLVALLGLAGIPAVGYLTPMAKHTLEKGRPNDPTVGGETKIRNIQSQR